MCAIINYIGDHILCGDIDITISSPWHTRHVSSSYQHFVNLSMIHGFKNFETKTHSTNSV